MRLVGTVFVLSGLILTVSGLDPLSGQTGPKPFLLEAGHDAGHYFVKISGSAEAQRILHRRPDFQRWVSRGLIAPGINYWPQAELLAGYASATVFAYGGLPPMRGSWAAQTVAPIPLDGVWRGPDPLSCLKSFAQAAGLDVLAPEPRLWLVGLPEQLDHAALVVFTYSMTAEGQPAQPTDADVDLARAIAAQLPIRQVAMEYEPVSDREGKAAERIIPVFMGIGTYWVPGEPDTLLAVISEGAFDSATRGFPELRVSVFKLHVTREGGQTKVECLWVQHANGPLIPGFAEDLDGDGVQEYFFKTFRNLDETADLLVSGADGRAIEVIASTFAVEKNASGPKRFAVSILREEIEGPDDVLRFAEETRVVEAALPEATATQQRPERASRPRPEEALAAALGGGERMRIYAFTEGGAFPVPNAEIIRASYHPVWRNWFGNRAPAETIESIPSGLPVRIVYKVLTPGYLKVREREKEVLGR